MPGLHLQQKHHAHCDVLASCTSSSSELRYMHRLILSNSSMIAHANFNLSRSTQCGAMLASIRAAAEGVMRSLHLPQHQHPIEGVLASIAAAVQGVMGA